MTGVSRSSVENETSSGGSSSGVAPGSSPPGSSPPGSSIGPGGGGGGGGGGVSSAQTFEHQSSLKIFPSSHVSPDSIIKLPHTDTD